ncbi:hypothetical protein CIB84_002507 [Bambusicola thoracicus]|uniref:Uncharacterized protein n=1 Tax=Bambusicola thoracicus TaxID=9083 RepID=A0A2P4TBK2_BAMTH|nr:hypothetical protein CIB84_002507 [Bambusicola thoracicus]
MLVSEEILLAAELKYTFSFLVAYYMEGRDSAQLIYRWTKSVDPSLKKGPWTPEEDAMLLAAVEKYGERDWYKIRTEVPGRSDAQCSDRYLKALHRDVKKGKWSLKEEEQLIDLVQKHGLGHWSKIASELPHRTRSQCLSKWKIMIGSKKRSRSAKRQHAEESSSCSESSSEDVELDLSDTSEEEKTNKEECTFPSIDLWIPTQTDVPESCQGRHQASSPFSFGGVNARTSSSKIPNARCEGGEEGVNTKATELSTILRGMARPHSTDITVKNPIEEINKLFRIDTNGCMKIIRERRADAARPQQASQNSEPSPGNASQPASKTQTALPALPSPPAPLAQAHRQKPKTVSELLREKRQMEKQLKEKAMQTKLFVAPQMMLSGPLIIQHPLQQIIPSAQVGSKPGAGGSTDSQVQCVPASPSALTSVAGSASTPVVLESHSPSVPKVGELPGSSQETKVQSNKELNEQGPQNTPERGVFPSLNLPAAGKAPDQGGCDGQVLAGSSAPVVFQNQAFVPRRITVMPFGIESGNSKVSLPAPVTYELTRPGSVNLLPALLAPQPGSHLTPDSMLPITWIVTQQALLSSAVQAVVGVPHGLQAAVVRNPSQASVTSSGNVFGLGAPPVSSGVNIPHPNHAETKTNPQVAAGSPAAVSHSASVFPVSSADPVCSVSGVSSATSAHSDSSSKTVDSSAAQNVLPGGAPTLHAQLLPQMQLPANTQGSDSHCVTDVSSGEKQDSSTTNGSSSNSDVLHKGDVLQPRASIPHDSVAGNSEGSADQGLKYRPIASKPPPEQTESAPPQPTTSSAEKTLLDYSLISLEDEELVKEWLSGKQGVQVPPLQTRLPYFPPFLCNLKTLSKLLLQKAALEKQAARFLSPDGSQTEGEVDLNAITKLVHEKLGNDPAFLLLKARFLAAFTLPAVLATLPPPKVATTLSASRREYGESDEEEWQSEEEASEDESCGDEFDATSDGTGGDEPGDRDADFPSKIGSWDDLLSHSIKEGCSPGRFLQRQDLDERAQTGRRGVKAFVCTSPEDNDETCWNSLENFRVKLISVIDPSRITPYLRQCQVINHDDEEQVLNDPSLVMRKRKAGVLLDILQRTGHKGFEAFMESLELYYPQLYKKITGKEPSRVFSLIIDTAGESGLSQLLMNEITKLQRTVQEERQKAQELTVWLHTKENMIREMWVRDSLLRKHQERVQKMREERDSLSKELRKCKDENYNLAMSYARQSEEKSSALMKNRDLLLEIDSLKHSLMKAEDDCKLERKHSMKLKHAIEQRPSHEVMWEIQQEKELLLAKNQELENTLQQVAREQNLEKSLSHETVQNDCSQMLERQDLLNTLYHLRKELRQAEVLRDKYAEEKEILELQCTSLRKDSQMYKKRMEAVLEQMEEVASERDQALLTREQFYTQYSKNLVERDTYRKQIRELGERCDELQLQLFQKESQLLATEAKLKRLQLELPALFDECSSAHEELSEKERRRMKDCFERYRRKRALRRAPAGRRPEADWEPSTGSDNTDTEGS